MADDVSITFSAQIGQLISGVDQVKEAISSIAGPVNSLASVFTSFGSAFAGAFAVDQVANFISQMETLGTNTLRTAAMLGVSTTEAQQLGFIAKATGGDADSLALSMERLQVNLQKAQSGTGPAAQALQALGLSARALIGLPLDQQLNKIADAVSKYGDGGNKTAIVIDLLGRSGAQMIPVLDQGSAGMDKLRQSAEGAGAIVSQQTVAALGRAETAATTMRASVTALGEALVGAFSKQIVEATNSLTEFVGSLSALVQTGHMGEAAFAALGAGAHIAAAQFANLALVASDVLTLSWSKAADDWKAGNEQIKQLQQSSDAQLLAMATQSKSELQKILAAPVDTAKPQAPAMAVPNKDALNASMEAAQEQIKLADSVYQQQVEKYNSEFKMHEMTESQKTAATLAALDVRYGAELVASDKEIATYAVGTAGYQKALNERTQLTEKFAKDHQKIIDQAAEEEAKQWQKAADTLAGAFNSQLKGLLSGTTSWSHAMKNISADLVLKFIEDQVKISVEFLANQARQLATTVATQAGMTSATTAGAAARSAAEMMSGETSILSIVANAMKSIFASAGQTSAEVAAWSAPYAGPAAPGIGAAAGAAVIGSSSALAMYEAGTNYVPKTGLAMIHQGETIIPAGVPMSRGSGPFTGGAGQPQIHAPVSISVSAMDSQSVRRFFNDNSKHMMEAINAAVKRGAHLGMQGAR